MRNSLLDVNKRNVSRCKWPLKMPLVAIYGRRRVLIENHRGVTEYRKDRIGIRVSYGQIAVCGSGLELVRMSKEQLVIRGRIDSITVCRR